jgi:acetylornithine deacetylase/succinyl-diaminopimelate desuccinylase
VGLEGRSAEVAVVDVRSVVDRNTVSELTRELVRIPSYPGTVRQEEAVVIALQRFLSAHRIETRVEEVEPGRPNLLAIHRGDRPGRHLLLCGHTDTVPPNPGTETQALSAAIHDGQIIGRGAVDMKGALAAMACALVQLKQRGCDQGQISFAAVIDEELRSLGAEALLRSGLRADGAVIGEPTDNRLALGHKGLEWLELRFHGLASHGGTPSAGINAIEAAAQFVASVDLELRAKWALEPHPLLGPATLNIGTIAGGEQPSTVAAACRLTVDRRTLPGESFAGVVEELRQLALRSQRSFPGLEVEIVRVATGMATLEHHAALIAPDHPLVQACERALEAKSAATVFPAWTDAGLLSTFGAIPCVILGPGDLALAHSPREAVSIAELERAVELYTRIALDFCRVA